MQSFAGFFRKNVKSISAGYGRGVLIGARVRKIFREKVSGGGDAYSGLKSNRYLQHRLSSPETGSYVKSQKRHL